MLEMENVYPQSLSVSLAVKQTVKRSRRFSEFGKWPLVVCMLMALGNAMTQSPVKTFITPDSKSLAKAEVVGIYFTPPSDVAAAVVEVIDQSQTEVLVQAYGFTHNGIAQALLRAHARGVQVKVLLDAKTDTTNRFVTDLLVAQRIPLRLDAGHAIAHNKVIVVDGELVITGSFNFTNSAQTRNAENLLVLKSIELADSYKANWQNHWNHSR
jgi:phosphatidylserine/phosphatidylglycerophosphate/cardiolipin synthase-like enzyme